MSQSGAKWQATNVERRIIIKWCGCAHGRRWICVLRNFGDINRKKKKKICANIVFTCHIITFSVYFRLTQQIVYVAMSTFEFHVCVHMYAATSIYIVSLTHSLSSVYLFMSFALKFRPRYFSIQFQKGIYTLYVHCFRSAISMASELCEFQTVGLNSYCQTLIPMSIRWNTVPWIDDYCVCR